MIKHSIITIFLAALYISGDCQETLMLDKLNGFRLGQYNSIVLNEYGQPDIERILEDSTKVDFYFLDSDSSTHIAFIYLDGNEKIYSIQVTGENLPIPFYGLRLGDNAKDIMLSFPNVDSIIETEFNDQTTQTWIYRDRNLSFVTLNNQMSSIKIWDDYSQPDYSADDYNFPDLEHYIETISRLDTSSIAEFLSPNLEVFHCENVISWKNSIRTDIYSKNSSVFEFVTNRQYGLFTLSQLDTIGAELNIRYIEDYGTFAVFKLTNSELIEEIVFNYQQGKYKIWEIKYKCAKND